MCASGRRIVPIPCVTRAARPARQKNKKTNKFFDPGAEAPGEETNYFFKTIKNYQPT